MINHTSSHEQETKTTGVVKKTQFKNHRENPINDPFFLLWELLFGHRVNELEVQHILTALKSTINFA